MLKIQEYSGKSQGIIDFIILVDKDFYPPISKRKRIEDYVLDSLAEPHYVLVVWDNDTIIGSVCTCLDMPEKGEGYIYWLAILPNYRTQGLATKLINNVEKYLRKNTYNKIKVRTWSTNMASIALYTKLGFSTDYVIKNERGNGVDSIYFVKNLA